MSFKYHFDTKGCDLMVFRSKPPAIYPTKGSLIKKLYLSPSTGVRSIILTASVEVGWRSNQLLWIGQGGRVIAHNFDLHGRA
jgi:hypothetical protein